MHQRPRDRALVGITGARLRPEPSVKDCVAWHVTSASRTKPCERSASRSVKKSRPPRTFLHSWLLLIGNEVLVAPATCPPQCTGRAPALPLGSKFSTAS